MCPFTFTFLSLFFFLQFNDLFSLVSTAAYPDVYAWHNIRERERKKKDEFESGKWSFQIWRGKVWGFYKISATESTLVRKQTGKKEVSLSLSLSDELLLVSIISFFSSSFLPRCRSSTIFFWAFVVRITRHIQTWQM